MSRFFKRVRRSLSGSSSEPSASRSSSPVASRSSSPVASRSSSPVASPASSPNASPRSHDKADDVWDLSPKQDKLAAEKALCTKYGSCEDYTRMFCKSLPMAKRAEFEDFLKYAKVHNILKPSATIEDVQVLCQTFRDNA